ncbi:unnamed protein product [Didymodactylos carnosus]|uniref:AMP-dependent synthetase/ligase domain-containing protein n=1 Tax=Didymodactylos carnosus TaxID=1234261 RepID=A0A8S2GX86_9BILA|nr:unnamed protein product [Didymodactylos carnosus]CAF3549834.1 unnamed protein product [Didymodactylos carnosus]
MVASESDEMKKTTDARNYWKELLADYDPDLQLPYDHQRLSSLDCQSFVPSSSFNFNLEDRQLIDSILGCCTNYSVTLFQLFLTNYYLFLFKVTQGTAKDICVYSNHPCSERLAFIPYRFKLDPRLTFLEVVMHVQKLCHKMQPYLEFETDEIINNISQRDLPVLKFLLQESPRSKTDAKNDLSQLQSSLYTSKSEREQEVKFDLQLWIRCNLEDQTMKCSFDFSTDLFEQTTIDIMSRRFQTLLKQLFLSSSFDVERSPVYELSILLPDELRLLRDLNDNHIQFEQEMKCIHQQFTETANKNPQKLAVILDEQSLTYAELLVYVQHLSLSLMNDHHVVPGSIICQCVERSIEMVIGILSILTCGAVYCPLSPNDPPERLCSLIQETKSKHILIHELTEERFSVSVEDKNFIRIDVKRIFGSGALNGKQLNLLSAVPVDVEKVAYVIFTSGSTGTPKAVRCCCLFQNVGKYYIA